MHPSPSGKVTHTFLCKADRDRTVQKLPQLSAFQPPSAPRTHTAESPTGTPNPASFILKTLLREHETTQPAQLAGAGVLPLQGSGASGLVTAFRAWCIPVAS